MLLFGPCMFICLDKHFQHVGVFHYLFNYDIPQLDNSDTLFFENDSIIEHFI